MSGSGVLREKKQESVQFWLAIGATSLLFHALLIVGLKRWVTIAVVDESEPISVEFVDPSGDAVPVGEPIVQAAAMKPEAKPEVKPEVQPEPEPEIKAEVQPEPIVQPEVKKVEPAIGSNETKPKVTKRPNKKTTPTTGKKSRSDEVQKGPPANGETGLGGGKDLSGELGTIGQRTVGITLLSTLQNETGGADDRKATLRFKPFPSTSQLSANLIRDVGKSITIPVTVLISCTESQGLACIPSRIKIEYQSSRFPPNLSSEYDQELEKAIDNWIQTLQAESLVYETDPVGTTDSVKKPPTYWTIQVQLQGGN